MLIPFYLELKTAKRLTFDLVRHEICVRGWRDTPSRHLFNAVRS